MSFNQHVCTHWGCNEAFYQLSDLISHTERIHDDAEKAKDHNCRLEIPTIGTLHRQNNHTDFEPLLSSVPKSSPPPLSANPSVEHYSYGTTATHITTNAPPKPNSTTESNSQSPRAKDIQPISEPVRNLSADTSVSQIVQTGDEIFSGSPHDTEQVIEGSDTEDGYHKTRNTTSTSVEEDTCQAGAQFPLDTLRERNLPLECRQLRQED